MEMGKDQELKMQKARKRTQIATTTTTLNQLKNQELHARKSCCKPNARKWKWQARAGRSTLDWYAAAGGKLAKSALGDAGGWWAVLECVCVGALVVGTWALFGHLALARNFEIFHDMLSNNNNKSKN
ncbi:unnamed protein product [Ceratitis capitata]|uniref:(Mediterranean fruit fly) hypothetical protein n=1 Tax=Ceratitis capitata TaxID=7213 RepID=A0A811V5U3_CERCA|nr:unnamed protein product [Ceratitis capitata]